MARSPAALQQLLRPLLLQQQQQAAARQLSTSAAPAAAAAAAASPALAVAASAAGIRGRINTPLSEPLPGVPSVKPSAQPKPQMQLVTGLEGGCRAVATDAPGPNTCVAVFVGAGSADEAAADASGAAKLLEAMAFRSTLHRSTFRVSRELEKYGAVATAVAGREHMAFCVEATKMHAAEATELLLDCVLNGRLADWELKDVKESVAEECAAASASPGMLAVELLHRAAFRGGLGQPLVPDAEALEETDGEVLRAFAARHLVPRNLVIAATGMSPDQLRAFAGPLLAEAAAALGGGGGGGAPPSSSSSSSSSSKYVGGFLTALAPSVAPAVGLAFELKGGLADPKATAVAAVAKALLNAPVRESVPFSRKSDAAPAALAAGYAPIAHLYRGTGLVGLVAGCAPGGATAALDALSAQFDALASKPVSDGALASAKQLALGGYAAAVSAKPGAVQDAGMQLLARGKYSAGDYASAVAAVTAADVAAMARAALGSAPTVVATGALRDLPRYDVTARKFVA
jgi:mitochondrial-processing peptidase subunit alpha